MDFPTLHTYATGQIGGGGLSVPHFGDAAEDLTAEGLFFLSAGVNLNFCLIEKQYLKVLLKIVEPYKKVSITDFSPVPSPEI